jgi:peptidyl-tRNA hydrolase
MTDIETDLMLARAEIATLKADLAALTARAAKAEQERDRAIEDLLKEIIKLACESVEREKTLARLEAEVVARLEERHETD